MKLLTKSYLSILYFLLLTYFCQAQLSLGVRGGLHIAEIPLSSGYANIVDNLNFRSAYQFGLIGNYQITNGFALQAEILYLQKGVGLELYAGGFSGAYDDELYNLHYNYLEIPLLTKFCYNLNHKIILSVDAGFSYGYMLDGSYYFKYIDSDGEIYEEKEKIDLKDDFSNLARNEYNFIYGLGVSVPIRRFKINFDMRFSKGLTNVQSERGFSYHTKNRGFGFATSILFCLSK